LKKKLAPRIPFSVNDWAIVREIVDLPVPAIPFSQKIHSPSREVPHSNICRRMSTRVPGWHLALSASV
jgi:hypothetical protein